MTEETGGTGRCLIIAAGPMGEYGAILRKAAPRAGDRVLCVDGGYRHAAGLGLTPEAVIGDLDSLGDAPAGVRVLRFPPEKDQTDTVLAIDYALRQGCRELCILGGLRGRLDHTYANFCALQYIYHHGATGSILDADNEVYLLEAGSVSFPHRKDTYISVFPFGERAGGVTERGLKYPLEDATLHSDFPLGVSNEFAAPTAVISAEKGPLLIILSQKEKA
jgi:thiamine pyrophosphokinase